MAPTAPTPSTKPNTLPEFTILIDGDCPLCKREASLMTWMDRGRGRLAQVNIADPTFDAAALGLTREGVMATIHGLTRDGKVVTGMETFRRAYAALGWGWVLAWSDWPVLRPIANAGYRWFAKNRLWLTGRPCDTGACAAVRG
jgi:predicted DCC family thiol-disulfide oxidoreductase YuxK